MMFYWMFVCPSCDIWAHIIPVIGQLARQAIIYCPNCKGLMVVARASKEEV